MLPVSNRRRLAVLLAALMIGTALGCSTRRAAAPPGAAPQGTERVPAPVAVATRPPAEWRLDLDGDGKVDRAVAGGEPDRDGVSPPVIVYRATAPANPEPLPAVDALPGVGIPGRFAGRPETVTAKDVTGDGGPEAIVEYVSHGASAQPREVWITQWDGHQFRLLFRTLLDNWRGEVHWTATDGHLTVSCQPMAALERQSDAHVAFTERWQWKGNQFHLQRVAYTAPTTRQAAFNAGEHLLRAGRYDEAVGAYRSVHGLPQGSGTESLPRDWATLATLRLAELAVAEGDVAEAVRLLDGAAGSATGEIGSVHLMREQLRTAVKRGPADAKTSALQAITAVHAPVRCPKCPFGFSDLPHEGLLLGGFLAAFPEAYRWTADRVQQRLKELGLAARQVAWFGDPKALAVTGGESGLLLATRVSDGWRSAPMWLLPQRAGFEFADFAGGDVLTARQGPNLVGLDVSGDVLRFLIPEGTGWRPIRVRPLTPGPCETEAAP